MLKYFVPHVQLEDENIKSSWPSCNLKGINLKMRTQRLQKKGITILTCTYSTHSPQLIETFHPCLRLKGTNNETFFALAFNQKAKILK